jgi:hypothetical protein
LFSGHYFFPKAMSQTSPVCEISSHKKTLENT